MSDLISRSSLINKIRGIVPGSQDVDFIIGLIENQPTAFDKEKVVAELEKEQRKDIEDAKFYRDTKNEKLCIAYTSKARAYKDAIEIVRKGGAE